MPRSRTPAPAARAPPGDRRARLGLTLALSGWTSYRVAALGCLLALAGCGQASHHTTSTAPPAKKTSPAPQKVQTGGAPIGLLVYNGALWAADAQRNQLVRVAPESGRVTGTVPVGRTPLRIVAFQGSIWSTDFRAGTVSQVSPSRLHRVATVHVGPQPEGIVAFGADLWVVSQQGGYLARVKPGASHSAERVPVGSQPRQVAAGGGHLWVSVFGDDSVAEVDPHSRRVVAHIKACGGPQGLAYAAGQLWVGCTNDGVLVDIDARSRKVVRHVTYEAADAVTNTGATMQVTSDQGPSTAALDPRTGRLTGNVKLSDAFIGDANADVVAAAGDVWVSSPDEGIVYRMP